MEYQDMSNYKFLDVGCKIGKSFAVAKEFGYSDKQGFGIDINQKHINTFNASGYAGIVASATSIPFPDGSFELVIFNHVLEHMKGAENGKLALSECLRVASRVLYVGLPFFDEDAYLNSLGLKTFYSDWHGHPNKVHLKTLTTEWLAGYKCEVNMMKKLTNSMFPEILPIGAPPDSGDYNPELHGPKPNIEFDRDIWREYTVTVYK